MTRGHGVVALEMDVYELCRVGLLNKLWGWRGVLVFPLTSNISSNIFLLQYWPLFYLLTGLSHQQYSKTEANKKKQGALPVRAGEYCKKRSSNKLIRMSKPDSLIFKSTGFCWFEGLCHGAKREIGKCKISSQEPRCVWQQASSVPLGVEETKAVPSHSLGTHCATGITFVHIRQYNSHTGRVFCSQHSLRSSTG